MKTETMFRALVVVLLLAVAVNLRAVNQRLREISVQLQQPTPRPFSPQTDGLPLGTKAPDFTLQDLKGNSVSSKEWAGSGAVVVFVSPGCGACDSLLAELSDISGGMALKLVVVSVGSREASLSSYGVFDRLCIVVDEGGTVARRYANRVRPFAFVIGSDGVIKNKGIISSARVLEALLGGPGK
ncbi:MAG: peroxiredoxin family protein [Bacillota bacterium]